MRAGTITAVQSGSTVQFNEVSTVDMGNTNGLALSVVVSGPNLQLQASASSDNWSVKTILRGL